MKKQLGGLAIAVAAVIGFTSPAVAAAAGPIVITPGYKGVITTNEPATFEFTGCAGTIEFVLAVFDENLNEKFTFLGSVQGPNGSWTFSSPTPGTFKIIVNCFVDGVKDSTDFVHFEVVPPPVDTTVPPVPTTPAPVPTTAGPAPTTVAPVVPVPTTTRPALPGATTTSVVGALAPGTTQGASVSNAGALPATGRDNAALLAAAGALLVIGSTLVLVRRRPA